MSSFIRKHFELRASANCASFLLSPPFSQRVARLRQTIALPSAEGLSTTSMKVAPKRSLISELILHQQKLHTVGSVLSSPKTAGRAKNKGILLPRRLMALLRKPHRRPAAGTRGQSFLRSPGTNHSWWQTVLKCSWH